MTDSFEENSGMVVAAAPKMRRRRSWWEKWGKAAGAIMLTASIVGGVIAGAIRLSKLEARAEKVDDLMMAMQNLREVLIKNGIDWKPEEFPPIQPMAMSAEIPEADETDRVATIKQIMEWITYFQNTVNDLTRDSGDLKDRIRELERKVDPFPLVPNLDAGTIRPFDIGRRVPVLPIRSPDAGTIRPRSVDGGLP